MHGKWGMCGKGGHAWTGQLHGRGACVVGVCMAGGVCFGGGCHAWQERWPLQRTVRILLECILVVIVIVCSLQFILSLLQFIFEIIFLLDG